MEEIDRQLEMGMDAIAEEDKWMLDVDVDQLKKLPVSDLQYWVHAAEAQQDRLDTAQWRCRRGQPIAGRKYAKMT